MKFILLALFTQSLFAQISPMENYNPTDISSAKATQLFKEMNLATNKKSQCFNRAHVWTNEIATKHDVKGMKIFIYFSDLYKDHLDDGWGFHVAPLYRVEGRDMALDGEVGNYWSPMILDGKNFRNVSRVPLTDKEWENFWIYSAQRKLESKRVGFVNKLKEYRSELSSTSSKSKKRRLKKSIKKINEKMAKYLVTEDAPAKITCKEVVDYNDFIQDPNADKEYCYIQKTSMYYMNWGELRSLNNGEFNPKNQWIITELEAARKEAFKNYDKIWETADQRKKREKEEN